MKSLLREEPFSLYSIVINLNRFNENHGTFLIQRPYIYRTLGMLTII